MLLNQHSACQHTQRPLGAGNNRRCIFLSSASRCPKQNRKTIRSETSTTTRHRDANTPAAGQSVDEEHEVTTVACTKTGCQRPWNCNCGTGAPVVDQHGHNNNLVRKLHHENEELDHGELPLRTTGMSGQPGTCRCTTKNKHTLSKNCTSHKPL